MALREESCFAKIRRISQDFGSCLKKFELDFELEWILTRLIRNWDIEIGLITRRLRIRGFGRYGRFIQVCSG